MKLGDWRRAEGLTQQQLADGIGSVIATVARYEGGTRTPEQGALKAIYIFTCGRVAPNDFHDVPAWEAELIRREGDREIARKAA